MYVGIVTIKSSRVQKRHHSGSAFACAQAAGFETAPLRGSTDSTCRNASEHWAGLEILLC